MTKVRTRTPITNTPTTPVTIGQGFWSWSRRVTTSHWVNCRPLLSRRGSRQWPESPKALKGWGMDLSWWNVLGNCRQWVFSRPLDLFIDQYTFPSTKHWIHHVASSVPWAVRHDGDGNQDGTAGTGCSWGPQGDGEEGYWKGPHQHPVSDLQLSRPPERDHGRLSKSEGGLVCSKPMCCFNCNKFCRTSQCCKVAAKCPGCGKDKHEGQCDGPKLCSNCNGPQASSAKDCPVWQKEKEVQHVRVEKRISFLEARQLVEAKMPTVITGGKTYAAAATTRRDSKSVECQTSLTFFSSSECPLRTTESNIHSSGGPGSVSAGTQASSGQSKMVLADAWVPCESAKCSSEMDRVSADPQKWRPLGVPPIPTKWHLRVQWLPPKVHLRVQQVP